MEHNKQVYNVVMSMVEGDGADQPIVVFDGTHARCLEMVIKITEKRWVISGNKAYNAVYIRQIEVLTTEEMEAKYGGEDEDEDEDEEYDENALGEPFSI